MLENRAAQGAPRQFVAAATTGLPRVVGRGLAVADYDNDGRLDIALNSVGGRLILLKGTAAGGNWLEVSLAGFHPGARVTAVLPDGRRLVREVQAGSSYLSSEDPRVHFGLGRATKVSELIVRFPSGRETRLAGIPANRRVSVSEEPWRLAGCTPELGGRSVARIWDEAVLDAIRRDVPAPTTHARNLFHLSAGMWDAWAAYDRSADGYFVREKHRSGDVQSARETAISYAAYRILLWRYAQGAGLQTTFDALTATMTSLCLSPAYTNARGECSRRPREPDRGGRDRRGPARRLARAAGLRRPELPGRERAARRGAAGRHHARPGLLAAAGARPDRRAERDRRSRPGAVVHRRGVGSRARLRAAGLAQGLPIDRLPIDPGKPPFGTADSASYKQQAVEVIRASAELDANDATTIDVGPGSFGDNPLGANGGDGYERNPVTGKPYAPNVARRADFARLVTEFWADGPSSETPPGHWNVVANVVSDSPLLAARVGTSAAERLKWDVRLYFALNGSVHDAAIAAWGIKRKYNGVRPISMIRYLAGHGQSSDPAGPSYDREGPSARARSDRGRHRVLERARAAPCSPRRKRGGDRGPLVARQDGRRLGARRQLVDLPAPDVRHPRVPRLRLRSQHLQPRRGRGDDRDHREPVLPRRPLRGDDRAGLPEARARPERSR